MSGGEGLRRKRPTRTTKGTLVQLNQQKVREKILPNLSAALEAAAMAMDSRWMNDDTVRSVGGLRMQRLSSCATRKERATVAVTNQQLREKSGRLDARSTRGRLPTRVSIRRILYSKFGERLD
jgi:hypothetical protein